MEASVRHPAPGRNHPKLLDRIHLIVKENASSSIQNHALCARVGLTRGLGREKAAHER